MNTADLFTGTSGYGSGRRRGKRRFIPLLLTAAAVMLMSCVFPAGAVPTGEHHGWKFIAFGPDGKLYIPVGVPRNICESEDERFGTIMRMNPNGSLLVSDDKGGAVYRIYYED